MPVSRNLAQRLAGSSEIFHAAGRAPQAGINFITAHDGFTLRDLVSYQKKHNELNGEGNRDGHGHNLSWNCGEEGESSDPAGTRKRRRLQRALLTTLLIAQGVPMLQGGDELGRTQGGNNNAYCQDNAMTWLDWQNADGGLIDFVAGLIGLRRRFPQLRRRRWLTGKATTTSSPTSSGGIPQAGRCTLPTGSRKSWRLRHAARPGHAAAGQQGQRNLAVPDQPRRNPGALSCCRPVSGGKSATAAPKPPSPACRREKTTPVAARSVQILSRE
jgi:pullulanase/glycogen debranching enzyme